MKEKWNYVWKKRDCCISQKQVSHSTTFFFNQRLMLKRENVAICTTWSKSLKKALSPFYPFFSLQFNGFILFESLIVSLNSSCVEKRSFFAPKINSLQWNNIFCSRLLPSPAALSPSSSWLRLSAHLLGSHHTDGVKASLHNVSQKGHPLRCHSMQNQSLVAQGPIVQVRDLLQLKSEKSPFFHHKLWVKWTLGWPLVLKWGSGWKWHGLKKSSCRF